MLFNQQRYQRERERGISYSKRAKKTVVKPRIYLKTINATVLTLILSLRMKTILPSHNYIQQVFIPHCLYNPGMLDSKKILAA